MEKEYIVQGCIYTANKDMKFARAMALQNGKILYVGDLQGAKNILPAAPIIKKQGFIMPGIAEGHAHITCTSETVFGVTLNNLHSVEEYQDKIRDFIKTHPEEKVIWGSGYDNGIFDSTGPTARLLDRVEKERPVVMIASDHHSRWLNTTALKLAGITDETPNPANGEIVRYPNGKATGWLKEAAMDFSAKVLEKLDRKDYAKAIERYQQIAFENGVTMAFEPLYDCRRDYAERAAGYKYLEDRGKLLMTVTLGYSVEGGDDFTLCLEDMLNIKKSLEKCTNVSLTNLKLFVDGVIECHTAYLRDDYSDSPGNCGRPMYSLDFMKNAILKAEMSGLDTHIHTIGDRATDMSISAIEYAQTETAKLKGKTDFRNCLVHLQIADSEQAKKMAENNIIACTNPYWHYYSPIYYNELEKPFLGEARAKAEYPMKTLLDAGVKISRASDFPVTFPPRSMDALHLMVNRTEPGVTEYPPLGGKECISVEDALQAMTLGGAYQMRLENRKGSLEKGKDADFAILTKNPFEIPKDELYTCEVAETYVGGQCVFKKI